MAETKPAYYPVTGESRQDWLENSRLKTYSTAKTPSPPRTTKIIKVKKS
jgi:hypothetical protein